MQKMEERWTQTMLRPMQTFMKDAYRAVPFSGNNDFLRVRARACVTPHNREETGDAGASCGG
jgi:hypothetical protein